MASDTIKIQFDFGEHDSKYSFISATKEYHNYNEHRNTTQELLTNLATGTAKSGFNALDVALEKTINERVIKALDKVIENAFR